MKDHRVSHWLQIGQALGLPAPTTDNHASGGGGGPGEGQKAQEEEGNFNTWRDTYRGALEDAEIVENSGSSRDRSRFDSTLHEKKQDASRKKKVEKAKVFKQTRLNECHHRNVSYGFCLDCGAEV